MKLANKYMTIFGVAIVLALIIKNAAGFSTAIRSVGAVVNSNAGTLASGGTNVRMP